MQLSSKNGENETTSGIFVRALAISVASGEEAAPAPVGEIDPNKPRVAGVGGGPGGLTTARDLALRGYPVTLFEGEKKLGGAMLLGVPGYRLPEDVLQRDIDDVVASGFKVQTGKALGRDFTLESLKADGYKAVFLGIGCTAPAPLTRSTDGSEIRGTDLDGVMSKSKVVIATTGVPGLIKPAAIQPKQVVLALSNPDPEIEPAAAIEAGAAFAADGKGVNNALAFPGLFKGALAARATRVNNAMKIAAATTIAKHAEGTDLVPNILRKEVHAAVADAVTQAAYKTGVVKHEQDIQ